MGTPLGGVPGTVAHLVTHKVKTSICGSTEHILRRNIFCPKVVTVHTANH